MADLGNLITLDPRVVWPSEARDFTPWLAANITSLGQAIGMDLEITATEAAVGDFSLDILAKDLGSGRQVVVENQFGSTNHDHLGKLLTYAAGLDAVAVIWLAETIREEHREALEWLNRRTDSETHFFAVVVEVLQIDDSRPAFKFKALVFPNEWQRAARDRADRQTSPRTEAYRQFFQALVDELREKYSFTKAKRGLPQSSQRFGPGGKSGRYGVGFVKGERVQAEVYLDEGDQEKNKGIFDALLAQRDQIDNDFGEPLEWQRLDHRLASRIAVYREGTIDDPEERLVEIRAWAVDRLLRLKRVFEPRL